MLSCLNDVGVLGGYGLEVVLLSNLYHPLNYHCWFSLHWVCCMVVPLEYNRSIYLHQANEMEKQTEETDFHFLWCVMAGMLEK